MLKKITDFHAASLDNKIFREVGFTNSHMSLKSVWVTRRISGQSINSVYPNNDVKNKLNVDSSHILTLQI